MLTKLIEPTSQYRQATEAQLLKKNWPNLMEFSVMLSNFTPDANSMLKGGDYILALSFR